MTALLARRAGDRVLCGRQVAGRYVCQGELARYDIDPRPFLPPGLALDTSRIADPGDPYDPRHMVDHYRLTSKAARQLASGRAPTGRVEVLEGEMIRTRRRGKFPQVTYVERQVTRDCPHCGRLALLDPKLLVTR